MAIGRSKLKSAETSDSELLTRRTPAGVAPKGRDVARRLRVWARLPPLLFLLAAGRWGRADPLSAPPSFEDLGARAAAARSAGNAPQAIDLYKQLLQLNPKWPDGWWFLGTLEYGASDYAPARDALGQFIALTPDAGPAIALRGLCEFEIGEYPQALKDIEDGLAHGAGTQSRNEHILKSHEALVLTRNGRFEEALRVYGFFAKDGTPPPDMAVGIGLAGLRVPLLPKEADTSQQGLYSAAGNAIFQFISGDAAGAAQSFDGLFSRYPATPNLHYVYGYLLFPSDIDHAAAEFKRELQVDPDNVPSQSILAWSALLRDDPAAALPYAVKVEAASPDLPVSQLVLGRALVGTGDVSGGIQHLERALQMQPENLETHLALVKAYSESGRKADAHRERMLALQMALPDAPRDPGP